ncbi:MAG: ArsR family transcriptional regulator, partial [Gammaproteobacteria bacterium]|nr:ArsR family transcriptional regulator [Gammaproteobacteria bacterium]
MSFRELSPSRFKSCWNGLRSPAFPRFALKRSSRAVGSASKQSSFLSLKYRNLYAPEVFNLLADTFKALGDPTRVQIVWSLTHGELCVTDIANLLDLTASAVSHHLRTLRNFE